MTPHRIHLLYVGRAKDCPRFSEIYGDTAAPIRPRQVGSAAERPKRTTPEAAGIPPEAQPAAVRGGRR